jgi:cardiolipin synthase A/B
VLHAKTAVIDDAVSTIGSSNLDYRSFVGNHEVNAVIFDAPFARQMNRMFAQDLRDSIEITQAAWSSRSLWQRAKEKTSLWLERLW